MPMPPPSPASETAPSLAHRLSTLVTDVRDLACDHLELAALEAQRAGLGLAKMLSAAVVVSVLLVSAWLALLAGGIVWMTSAGVSWTGALAMAAFANVLLAGFVLSWLRRQAGELLFSATLRQLRRTADATKGQPA